MLFASIATLAVLSILAPHIHRVTGRWTGALLALAPLFFFVWFAQQITGVGDGVAQVATLEWIPAIGLELALRLDGLSLLFSLLITGIGAIVLWYAGADLKGHQHLGRFYAYLIGFMTSMLGLVLTDNVLLVFIFWELTSITSYFLIGFDHNRLAARKAALQALLTTGLGGVVMLAGLVMIGEIGGSYRLSELVHAASHGEVVFSDHALYIPALVCLLAGCFTKSAQFPFHYWLPNAMEAPSPVSAYLHSSTMVKAGVFLLCRVSPIMGGTEVWYWTLGGFGAVTMVSAAYMATRQTYLKKLLAYSTVSSLGIMVMLLGLGEGHGEHAAGHATNGAKAAAAYLFAHALFKGTLFLVAGSVSHQAGIKDTEKLGKLARFMPLTMIAAVIGSLSMAGVPPMNGFAGKELLIKAGLNADDGSLLFVGLTFIAAAWTVFISFMIAWRVFFAKREPALDDYNREEVRDGSPALWLGPLALSAAAIVAGVMPSLFAQPLIAATVSSITGHEHAVEETKLSLAYMAKPGPAPLISACALVVGFFVYAGRRAWRRATDPIASLEPAIGPEAGYRAALGGMLGFAGWQTRVLQNGSLSVYIKTVVFAFVAIGWWSVMRTSEALANSFDPEWFLTPTPLEIAVAGLIIAATLLVAALKSRLAAVAVLGVVGYCVAMVFVLFGAPDVAMTQFSIETLTVIIFVLVLYSLPRFADYSKTSTRLFDAALATAFGSLMTALVMICHTEVVTNLAGEQAQPISRYFAQNSYTGAQGKNIVNVILVDFRGTDTLGEIFVLGLAAVGVYTLLTMRRARTRPEPGSESGSESGSGPEGAAA